MSATPHTAAVFDEHQRITPDDLFDELVFQSDEWCSACFQRIRRVDVTELGDDTDRLATSGNVLETRQRAAFGWLGHDFETHDEYGLQRSWKPRTFCADCGANNGHAPEMTISKREAVRRVDHLVDCLAVQGVTIHRETAKRYVAKAKERRSLHAREYDIFARAVAFARRHYVRETQ